MWSFGLKAKTKGSRPKAGPDDIELWVKFWEEESGEAALLATQLKRGLDGGEIGLAEEEATATAVNAILRALEAFALCI